MSHIELEKTKQAGLTANKDKCPWAQTTCEFLGHFAGGGRVSPSASKVQAVLDFAPSTIE